MGTMQIDKSIAYLFEDSQRSLRAVYKLPIAAGNRKNPFEQKLTLFARLYALFAEDPIDFNDVIQLKHGLDRALVSAGANKRLVRAFTEHKFEGAQDHRFPGAGLASHDAESGGQFPVQ